MQFLAIPDQEQVKKHLIYLANSHRIPHAQLLWGPPESPSLPLALAFATYLNCQHSLPEDACGYCVSCKKMEHLTHPDVRFTFPIQGAKNDSGDITSNHFIKLWHAFVKKQPYGDVTTWRHHLGVEDKPLTMPRAEAGAIGQYVQTPPLEGKYKINIIWLPEYVHPTTAYALLNLLEAPPVYSLFLLVSAAPEKLMAPFRSRLHALHVPALTDAAIVALLQRQYELPLKKIAAVARLAAGDLQKAYDLVAGGEEETVFEACAAWLRICYSQDMAKLLLTIEKWQTMPKERQKHFLSYILHIMRLVLLTRFMADPITGVWEEEQTFAKKLSPILDYDAIRQMATWINQAYYYIERNMNAKIVFLYVSLHLGQLFAVARHKRSTDG